MKEIANTVDYDYASMDEAFPPCEPGVRPYGSRVLCQLRTPKRKTKGGIILSDETRVTDHWNTQVAKVLATGPLSFMNRDTLKPWPEGAWCKVGDFVRVPKYGGDRWTVKVARDGEDDEVVIAMFNDTDLLGEVTGDPLKVKAFL